MTRVSLKDCNAPWEWLDINSSGNACCCCHSRGLIGNLNDTSFDDVWNGPTMLQLRKAITEDRFAPYCKGAACQYAKNRQSEIEKTGSPLPSTRRVDFTHSGNSLDFTVKGWSTPEPTHTWTVGSLAILKISRLPARYVPWSRLRIKAAGFPGHSGRSDVLISMNGYSIGTVISRNTKSKKQSFPIPSSIYWKQRNSPIEIAFDIKDPISPKALGVGDDDRELGLAVQWMQFG
jgi:hypothetical protein